MRLFPNIPPETEAPITFNLQDQSISLKPINKSIAILYINGTYIGKCNLKETTEQLKQVTEKNKVLEFYRKKPSSRGKIINFLQ
jgi:hypothetical protein